MGIVLKFLSISGEKLIFFQEGYLLFIEDNFCLSYLAQKIGFLVQRDQI